MIFIDAMRVKLIVPWLESFIVHRFISDIALTIFHFQYPFYDELYKYITVTIVVTSFAIEIVRLYLGYEGNLRDKVS